MTQDVPRFLEFAVEYGRNYLASGGSTTRIEEHLTWAGRQLGIEVEVAAMPTVLYISTFGATRSTAQTALGRISGSGIHLDKINQLEQLLTQLVLKNLSLDEGIRLLRGELYYKVSKASHAFTYLGGLVMGFAVSYKQYGLLFAAILSGVLTVFIQLLSGPVAQKAKLSPIFSAFTNSFLVLILGGFLTSLFQIPLEAIVFGSTLLIVPGLTITTAVGELADQNFLSGTIKLMRAILILLSMLIAYLLFKDVLVFLNAAPYEGIFLPTVELSWGMRALLTLFSVAGFSALFQIPPRAFWGALIVGLTSWIFLDLLSGLQLRVWNWFMGAFSVGALSVCFSYFSRLPSQIYAVPGVLSLLPGLLAFTSLQFFALGEELTALDKGFEVATTAGSIVFGLLSARVLLSWLPRRALLRGSEGAL